MAHELVGLLADWLALVISIQVTPCSTHPVQHKGLIRDAMQQAWVFSEHSAKQDKPAPQQTGCLNVPVFACVLCHEMERGCMIVSVKQCKYAPWGKTMGGLQGELDT